MRTTMLSGAFAACVLVAATPALAFDLQPDAVSVQVGAGPTNTAMAGVGILWDWDFKRVRHAEVTAYTELLVDSWRGAARGGGHTQYTEVALVPTLRLRFDEGRSPWFVELGVGPSYIDKPFSADLRTYFSTQWNFHDVVGVGRSLDVQRRHEINLRWTHVSNGGLKNPNPGQDFLQLRYIARF